MIDCPRCGIGPVTTVTLENHNVKWMDRVVIIDDAFSRCAHCGEEYYTAEQSHAHQSAIDEALKLT